jgi:hypothetical protein
LSCPQEKAGSYLAAVIVMVILALSPSASLLFYLSLKKWTVSGLMENGICRMQAFAILTAASMPWAQIGKCWLYGPAILCTGCKVADHPGFNDSHVHFMEGGFYLLGVDLRNIVMKGRVSIAQKGPFSGRRLISVAVGSRDNASRKLPGKLIDSAVPIIRCLWFVWTGILPAPIPWRFALPALIKTHLLHKAA